MPDDRRFPRPLVWGVACLVAVSLIAAGLGRLGNHRAPEAGETVAASRLLHFNDRPDGGVDVVDATNGVQVAVITGQSGFLRGTMRGLASARKRAGIGPEAPFRLASWPDGRLTLDDATDGRHVELEAFGPTNEAAFADLLVRPEGHR